jgi:serine/threonine protein kinase
VASAVVLCGSVGILFHLVGEYFVDFCPWLLFFCFRYTDKSDVYSFGVILAMLLTGRDPSDQFLTAESSRDGLVCWLRHKQQAGEAKEALDTSILGDEGEEEEMLMAMRIAVVCLSDLPADRPSSDELVSMLSQLHSF